jgi:hypothetical protein
MLHLRKTVVLQELGELLQSNVIQVSSAAQGRRKVPARIYSLKEMNRMPKIDSDISGTPGLSFERSFARKWSQQKLRVSGPLIPRTTEQTNWHRERFLRRKKIPISKEMSDSEKVAWNEIKSPLEKIYFASMVICKETLHLFIAELLALNVMSREGIIDSNKFKDSYEKLTSVYLGSYLSREVSDCVIDKLEVYQPRTSKNKT